MNTSLSDVEIRSVAVAHSVTDFSSVASTETTNFALTAACRADFVKTNIPFVMLNPAAISKSNPALVPSMKMFDKRSQHFGREAVRAQNRYAAKYRTQC